jgi:hypothetical protein
MRIRPFPAPSVLGARRGNRRFSLTGEWFANGERANA